MATNNNKQHFFYVLKCADNTLYAGYTTDLDRRLAEHNKGIGAKYTRIKKRRPLEMIYSESFQTKSEAMKKEYAFKQLTRIKKDIYIQKKGIH